MNKTKFYTVAGHTFRITMAESENVWQGMAPAYSPFEILPARQVLFVLTVGNFISPKEADLILRDSNLREEEAKLDVYRTACGYLFEMRTPFTNKLNSRLQISDDFHTAEVNLSGHDMQRLYGLNSALMLCYMPSTTSLDTLLMHASAVVNEGKAYLFLGRSGTGKSTHSRLWLQDISRTKHLNDDHPVIRIDPQGNAIAYGSPWSGKTSCYHNESAPIGAIVRIKQAPANSIRILSPIESYASLFTSSTGIAWEKTLADGKDRTLQKIISRVSCLRLECLPDKAAARLCASVVRKEKQCKE